MDDDGVTIEFKVDEPLSDLMTEKLARFPTEGLDLLFIAPILLKLGDVTFLDWEPTSLYALGRGRIDLIERLSQDGSNWLEVPESSYTLRFERHDDQVRVELEEVPEVSATVAYEELRKKWRAFAECVRNFLAAQFPAIAERPEMRNWLR